MKAADISEIDVLRFIDRMSRAPWPVTGEPHEGPPRWVMLWDFEHEAEWEGVPIKVIRAKLEKMIGSRPTRWLHLWVPRRLRVDGEGLRGVE
jgi:hypothetical protein